MDLKITTAGDVETSTTIVAVSNTSQKSQKTTICKYGKGKTTKVTYFKPVYYAFVQKVH